VSLGTDALQAMRLPASRHDASVKASLSEGNRGGF